MEPRFLSEAGSGLSEEQSQLAATIANIAQAGVFLSFGPMVCLYGPAIFRVVTFIRSLFASNYMAFIGAVAAADTMTYFEVFVDRAVILIAGTVTMTIASLRSKKIRAYTAGAVLGTQIAIPLMSLLRQQLYFNSGFVGCTGLGTKTAMFPDGEPTGCPGGFDSLEFQITFQGTKSLQVIIVSVFAFLGQRLMNFSISLMGATMIIDGTVDLLKTVLILILSADQTTTVLNFITTWNMVLTYSMAAFGYGMQKVLLNNKDKQDEDGVEETPKILAAKKALKEAKLEHAKASGMVMARIEQEYYLRKPENGDMPYCKCFHGKISPIDNIMDCMNKLDKYMGVMLEGDASKRAKKSKVGLVKNLISPKKKKKDVVAV